MQLLELSTAGYIFQNRKGVRVLPSALKDRVAYRLKSPKKKLYGTHYPRAKVYDRVYAGTGTQAS